MALSRATIRSLVEDAIGRTDKTSLIDSAIDIAVEEISTQRLWSDLLNEDDVIMTIDTQSVVLDATDIARVTEVRVIDGTTSRPIGLRSKTWVVTHFPNPSAVNSGKPTFGYLEGTTLFVVPLPDETYTIRYSYYRLHPAMTTDAQTVTIRHIGPAVAAYATFWVFQSIERHEDAERWLATYLKLLESARKIDKENSAVKQVFDQRGQVFVSGEYWLDPFVTGMPGSGGYYYGGY